MKNRRIQQEPAENAESFLCFLCGLLFNLENPNLETKKKILCGEMKKDGRTVISIKND
jgi:hypothetical protein